MKNNLTEFKTALVRAVDMGAKATGLTAKSRSAQIQLIQRGLTNGQGRIIAQVYNSARTRTEYVNKLNSPVPASTL